MKDPLITHKVVEISPEDVSRLAYMLHEACDNDSVRTYAMASAIHGYAAAMIEVATEDAIINTVSAIRLGRAMVAEIAEAYSKENPQ